MTGDAEAKVLAQFSALDLNDSVGSLSPELPSFDDVSKTPLSVLQLTNSLQWPMSIGRISTFLAL